MMPRSLFRMCGLLILGSLHCSLPAQAEPLTLEDVFQEVVRQSPDLAVTEMQAAIAEADLGRVESLLDTQARASIMVSDEKKPTSSPFMASQTKLGIFNSSLSKPLEDGSSLTASLNYTRSRVSYPAGSPIVLSMNPSYQEQIDLSYRYPLLKNHANPAYHQALLAGQSNVGAATWQQSLVAEQLLGRVINLYFQLVANEIALKQANNGLERAGELLAYQKYREAFGLIEAADRLQAEALLATRKMDAVRADAALKQSQAALKRLMQRPANDHLSLRSNFLPSNNTLPDTDSLLEEAMSRPQFKMLEDQLQAADANIEIARNEDRMQVDVIAQLGTRSLSASAGTAAAQGMSVKDRYVGIGLEFSDSWEGRSARAALRKAQLQREQILRQQAQQRDAVLTDLTNVRINLESGLSILQATRARMRAEKKKYQAEMQRYREGRSDTATVIQFEGDLRNAELQAALQSIVVEQSRRQLALLRGSLLTQLMEHKE